MVTYQLPTQVLQSFDFILFLFYFILFCWNIWIKVMWSHVLGRLFYAQRKNCQCRNIRTEVTWLRVVDMSLTCCYLVPRPSWPSGSGFRQRTVWYRVIVFPCSARTVRGKIQHQTLTLVYFVATPTPLYTIFNIQNDSIIPCKVITVA